MSFNEFISLAFWRINGCRLNCVDRRLNSDLHMPASRRPPTDDGSYCDNVSQRVSSLSGVKCGRRAFGHGIGKCNVYPDDQHFDSPKADAKLEAQQKQQQVRQATLPEGKAICNLLHGVKTRVVTSSQEFTHYTFSKSGRDLTGALIESAMEVYRTLEADVVTAGKAPHLQCGGLDRVPRPPRRLSPAV